LWTVMDPKTVSVIQQHMEDKKLIIADGHHRYETALAYRDEMRGEKGSDRIPMTFFNMNSPGLTILPTHRVLANLPAFDKHGFLDRAAQYFDMTAESAAEGVTIGVFAEGQLSFLRLKPTLDLASLLPDLSAKQRILDVVVLHRLILEN